ncbi:MAG: hypothetical protein RIT43_2425 [Bacteroidota bacterium]|jgi:hypothetical protein
MKDDIRHNLDNARRLEEIYQSDKSGFKSSFNEIFEEIQDQPLAQFWNERLNYVAPGISWGGKMDLPVIFVASLIAGFIAKLPVFTNIEESFYYSRNIGFVVLPILIGYFAWKQQFEQKKLLILSATVLFSIIFINLIPENSQSQTLILSCIHLPLFLWAVMGYSFVGNKYNDTNARLDYLRYMGDLVVMTTIILIAGIILTLLTLGLFNLINVDITTFYVEYVVVFGVAAAPIIGTYLVRTNPQLVNKVSPIIAKVFSPLVLVTLVIYLLAMIGSGKNLYMDRDFLFIFNMLLIGVMAIILFSVAETGKNDRSTASILILFALSAVTVIVNTIALSAILYRISEWGITANRLAVLGGNILILCNLIFVSLNLLKGIKNKELLGKVEDSIAFFLPVYSIWTVIVTFLFPILFQFK